MSLTLTLTAKLDHVLGHMDGDLLPSSQAELERSTGDVGKQAQLLRL